MSKNAFKKLISVLCVICVMLAPFVLSGCDSQGGNEQTEPTSDIDINIEGNLGGEWVDEYNNDTTVGAEDKTSDEAVNNGVSLGDIPEYSGKAYVVLDGNTPSFQASELTEKSFETYSSLDYLGRCGVAFACLGRDIMPTEERESIGQVKPSGWKTVKYDCVDGKYLYNRCHLIGFQLSGENANERNLITGTRYMNTQGMLPFENMVADYIKETDNHVMYRVTPVYEGENLVASGVQMEAYSVEDEGDGICFNVYCYNAQPEILIDYSNGESEYVGKSQDDEAKTEQEATYILNTNSKKFHNSDCSSVENMSEKNKSTFTGKRSELINQGYEPCGSCKP